MVEVKRRENETTGAMLRRFTRRVQHSGVLLTARKMRFYGKPLTRRLVKVRALRKIELAKEKTKLEKLGKLSEETKFYRR